MLWETAIIHWPQQGCYERLKQAHPEEDFSEHPARYALVELENLHDEAQEFEPIHRIITSVDTEELMEQLQETSCREGGFPISWYQERNGERYIWI